jgi:EAL domain-containing protein (putative c-di-GMP-specific phosphodiesterase class I)
VLAEGVETQEQLDFLRREGCDELQGYLLSPPAPVGMFADLLATPAAGPGLIRVA